MGVRLRATDGGNVPIGGESCLISDWVTTRDQNHEMYSPVGIIAADDGHRTAPVSIGGGVRMGAGSVVLTGVAAVEGGGCWRKLGSDSRRRSVRDRPSSAGQSHRDAPVQWEVG